VQNCLQISKNITRKTDTEQLSYETFSTIYFCANPGGRAVSSVGLKPVGCWDYGFESR
jgi:hypothetical protein